MPLELLRQHPRAKRRCCGPRIYDTADRLTRVDYPNGMFLQYTLDGGGRRIQMVDQTGFTVNYAYDAAGRLSGLTDGSGSPVVTYTYDAAGRLARKDNGNGTYTTYAYDANGNVLHLVNFAPDSSVNSRFDYSYDVLGRRTTMATLDGTWTYSYDGTGQLTHAVFASTNPTVANQDLVYNYDAVGNRTSTVINGVTTTYVANNLNEYTSVGGVAQSYDADGNLLSDGVNTYAYDVLNRLIAVTTPGGTTSYTYNALGNRSSTTTGGQVTQYLVDPTGMTVVTAEFDGEDHLVAHNTYGLGLTTRVTNGASYYYDFDALGSTVDMTGARSVTVNTYNYAPFGNLLNSTLLIDNPYVYIGMDGVSSAFLPW